jgi:hypothetical protein
VCYKRNKHVHLFMYSYPATALLPLPLCACAWALGSTALYLLSVMCGVIYGLHCPGLRAPVGLQQGPQHTLGPLLSFL